MFEIAQVTVFEIAQVACIMSLLECLLSAAITERNSIKLIVFHFAKDMTNRTFIHYH